MFCSSTSLLRAVPAFSKTVPEMACEPVPFTFLPVTVNVPDVCLFEPLTFTVKALSDSALVVCLRYVTVLFLSKYFPHMFSLFLPTASPFLFFPIP